MQKYAFALFGTVLFLLLCIILSIHFFDRGTDIQILHFNDLHSRFIASSVDTEADCTSGPDCVGGIARLKSLIDSQRDAFPNTLILSAGDNYQGSLFFSVFKEEALVKVLNMLSLDAMGLGNHEFDEGDESLARFITEANFPVVSGNTHIASSSPLSEKVLPYALVEFDGMQVGILSAVTASTTQLSSPGSDITFSNEQAHLAQMAKELTDAGVSILIAITHQGYEADIKTAQAIPSLDIIVGGHSDTLLSNTQENAEGPYPTVITSQNGDTTLIVQTRPYGTQLGQLFARFNSKGHITTYNGEPLIVDANIVENEALHTYIQRLDAQLQPIKETILTTTVKQIDGRPERCRNDDCPLGNLLTDALLRYPKKGAQATIALINSGSIRSSLPAGSITKNDLITAIPFNNEIVYLTLTGTELLGILEESVAKAGDRSGGFLQIGGISLGYDLSKEHGQQLCRTTHHTTGDAIDPKKSYTIATVAYLANGGDGYHMPSLSETSSSTIYDVLEEHFNNNQYQETNLNDRISTQCN